MNKLKNFLWKFSLIFYLLIGSPLFTFAFFRWIFTNKFEVPTIKETKWTKWIGVWQDKISKAMDVEFN